MFTDTVLPDGSWTDVIEFRENAGSPVNVIIVGSNLDIQFYWAALERAEFDFVLPPFEHEALDFIVKPASQNARRLGLAWRKVASYQASHRRRSSGGHRDFDDAVERKMLVECGICHIIAFVPLALQEP